MASSSARPQRRNDEDRADEDYRRREPAARRAPLNEYWIKGEGILRQVLQAEICKWLGAEATCRPGPYNDVDGYYIKAMRPFTSEMIEDLKRASREYGTEIRYNRDTYGRETRYEDSVTRERLDRGDPMYTDSSRQNGRGPSSRSDRDDRAESRYGGRMELDGPPYSSASASGHHQDPRPGYPSASVGGHHQDPRPGYSLDPRQGAYPPSSYSPSPNYSAAPSSAFPSTSRYPTEPGYPSYSSSIPYSSSAMPTSLPAYAAGMDARYGTVSDLARYQYEAPSSRDPGYSGYPSGYSEPPRPSRDLPPAGYGAYPPAPEAVGRREMTAREYQEYMASSGRSNGYDSARNPYEYDQPSSSSAYGASRGTPSDPYSSSRRR